MNANEFSVRARLATENRLTRRGFVEAVAELQFALAESLARNAEIVDSLSKARIEIKKLNATVSNYEKIVSARDRFGCWLCAKHEKESIHSDDDLDEKEALRNENVGLRDKLKRLESSISVRQDSRMNEGTALRSSMRSSDDSGSRSYARGPRRHIKFQGLLAPHANNDGRISRISMTSGRSSMGSSQDEQPVNRSSQSISRARVSFEEPIVSPIPESPLTTTLGRTTSVPGGPRKTRTKQVLFSSHPQTSPWVIKYSPAVSEQQEHNPPIHDNHTTQSDVADILCSISIVRSLFDHPEDDLLTLAKSMTLVKVDIGDTVSKQGEPGLFFMIVKSGEFVCESIGHPSRDLRQGDYFGEEIFIHPAPLATVSVTCTFAGELWAIYTDALRKVLRSISAKQMHVVRDTLEWLPKLIRDSINSTQFNSICKAAEIVTISPGHRLDEKLSITFDGLLVAIDGSMSRQSEPPRTLSKGSVVLNIQSLTAVTKSSFIIVNKREIVSIPPLAVAQNNLINNLDDDSGDVEEWPWIVPGNMPIPGSTRLRRVQLPTFDMSSPVSDFDTADRAAPLSPSLRPTLTDTDISNIPLFSLLSISARTHLTNRAKFLRIVGEDQCTVELGVVSIMSGTATVRDPISMKSVSLDQGHSIGLGSNTLFSSGQIEIFADNSFLDDDEGFVKPSVVVAYWSDETIRQSLPSTVREERNENFLISYLKRRKLLLKNPLFQYLHERGLERLITESRTIVLDHNRSVLVELGSTNEGFVVIEGQAKVGDRIVPMGDFYNCENLLSGIGQDSDPHGIDDRNLAATYLVSAFTVTCTIIIVSRDLYMEIFETEVSDAEEVKNRIRGYIAEIRQRIELSDVKVGKVIGRGGTAVVKLASVPREDTLYALKIIKKKFLEYHNKYQMLKNEKQVLQSLNKSEFVIKLRQTFKDDKSLYFLLELAPGGDLLSVLNKLGVLDRHQAQFYLGCMIEALKYCHENLVIYRDLKPENLLVDSKGYLKLSDFGIAKKFSRQTFLLTYSLVGTPQFMAPEILTGHGYAFSVDVWSLGCCLYELLIGELPFQADDSDAGGSDPSNQFRLFQSIVAFDASSIPFPETIDDASVSLIRGLLQPNPHRRLGCSVGAGIAEIEKHEFFESFEWLKLRTRELVPPYIPEVPPVMSKRPASVDGISMGEEPPLSSPALSVAASYSSFEPGGVAPSVWSLPPPRDTTISWDLNF